MVLSQNKMMEIKINCLTMTLSLLMMIYLAAARSLPSKQQMMEENWMVTTRREANSQSFSNHDDKTVSEIDQLQTEIANLSIPSYLKDLYINLTYPNGVAHPSSNNNEIKVNTIQSYRNKVKS